jgi:hypothetical protein
MDLALATMRRGCVLVEDGLKFSVHIASEGFREIAARVRDRAAAERRRVVRDRVAELTGELNSCGPSSIRSANTLASASQAPGVVLAVPSDEKPPLPVFRAKEPLQAGPPSEPGS